MVYMTILNLPLRYQSKLNSIMVVMAARYNQIKEVGQDIFRNIVNDLKILEEGVLIKGKLVKAGLLIYSGDNLESHHIGGFQTNFNKGYICRFCLIKHKDLCKFQQEKYQHKWSVEIYDALANDLREENSQQAPVAPNVIVDEEVIIESDEIADEIDDEIEEIYKEIDLAEDREEDSEEEEDEEEEQEAEETKGKIKFESIFNELKSFHAVSSLPNDIFHDLLEGGISQDSAAGVRIIVKRKKLSIEKLNTEIRNFPYCSTDERPSYFKETRPKQEKLPGKAMANLMFMRIVPYLLESYLENDQV